MPSRVITFREWRWVAFVSTIMLAISIVPNIWAYVTTPPGYHFIGFVYNWEEANPYLAKIVQGARGQWLYTLPYSAEPGDAFGLYFNYLLLGHIAVWLALEPIIIFHVARLFDSAVLLSSLYYFSARFFAEVRDRRLAFLLASFGAGFGWLLIGSGYIAADLWQTQIFPFLAMLANVHFPLAMAAQLWLVDSLVREPNQRATRREWLLLIGGTLILAMTQPYGLVVVVSVAGLWLGARWVREQRIPRDAIRLIAVMLVIALPFAAYYRWVSLTNLAYAGWDRQNITLSSPAWDYALSGGLILALAVIGAVVALQRMRKQLTANDLLLVAWLIVTVILMYLPITQQRRFAFALMAPLAILAVQGLTHLKRLNTSLMRVTLVAVSSITNIILLLLALFALSQHPPYLFFTQSEWNGLMYLRTHAAPHALVLASAEMGLFIPAWSGQRVIYGHPHETLDAQAHKAEVQNFFTGNLANVDTFLKPVDFIFVGPRERALGSPPIPANFTPVFSDGAVTIFAKQEAS